MSIQVNEFQHIPRKNDTEYIKLLKEALERQKQITSKAIAKIKELSSSSESPNGWIPCSERLPKYGQPVLTYNLEDDEYEVNHIIDEEDGEWFTYGVDAWMPLPDPWKEEEE